MSSALNSAYVCVCRHGQDEDNVEGLLNGHRDRPLSELGRAQAETVAQKIARHTEEHPSEAYDAILSSPLQRAFVTATSIGLAVKVPVLQDPELIERDFGVLSGKPYDEVFKICSGDQILKTDRVTYFLQAPESEDFDVCFARAERVLKRVDATYPGKRVLLVCHGDIGKMLQAARRGMSWRDGLMEPFVDNTAILELGYRRQ